MTPLFSQPGDRPRNNYRNDWWKNKRKAIIQERGGHCEFDGCLVTEKLEFAHVKRTKLSEIRRGRGRNARIADVLKNPEAYKQFCHSHHVEYDRSHSFVRETAAGAE
jgi:hypothetical protein